MTRLKHFKWTKKRGEAARMRAEGYTQKEIADALGLGKRTVERWGATEIFAEEVDRLTLMIGIAAKAARLRIVKRAVRQAVREDGVKTKRDLLDWLKFAQSETDGIKLDLTPFFVDALAMAGGGQAGDEPPDDSAGDGTDTDA